MKRTLLLATAACVLLAALRGDVEAAPEGVDVGDVRAVLAREGAPVRERPSALARATATIPHGTQLRVIEVKGRWIRVTPVGSPEVSASPAWLRANRTVEPFALTQEGQRGSVALRGGGPSQTDISAAGRQFDPSTEQAYRTANPDLQAFYPLVDRIEATKPDPEVIERFILEGKLGRPEGSR